MACSFLFELSYFLGIGSYSFNIITSLTKNIVELKSDVTKTLPLLSLLGYNNTYTAYNPIRGGGQILGFLNLLKDNKYRVQFKLSKSENDPVFCVTDLLPHLAKEQMDRKLGDGIRGEELNILIGSTPFRDDAVSEKVKLNIANILFEKYEITEEDFQSAELTMVPAGKARDVGFDRSLIGSYGHDDRVCAYGELTGILAADPEYTAVACFADKEETGSDGPTGMNSKMLSYFAMDLGRPYGIPGHVILSHSKCISADVNCAVDPTFDSVHEKNNAAYLNYGIVVTKYTGSGGKNSTNDAPAEFVGEVRKIMNDGEVLWQTGELGKVNEGGGGTVAKYISRLGVDTIDVGVPLLSMHAPMEIASKIDIFMMHKASEAFYNAK